MEKQDENRILRRQTTWYAINIKARREQKKAHYVNAFRSLLQQDPLVELDRNRCESIKSVVFSENLDKDAEPLWIKLTLLAYTIIDPEAFYNRRSREDITIKDWNADIVANKREAELIFIPSIHIIAVKRSSDISLNNIIKYLSEALNVIEPDGFDVSAIVERDVLDRILKAHAIMRIEANISYSNPGNTKGFRLAFEKEIKDMGADKLSIIASGTSEHPLLKKDEGLLEALVNMAEQDGNIKAIIQSTENSRLENIDSSEHPRVIVIQQIVNNVCTTIYRELTAIFGHNN